MVGVRAGEFRSATRNASGQRKGGWKKVMKPQITPAVEAVAADVHLGTTTMKSVSLPVSELKP
jgi:hypothetical protein